MPSITIGGRVIGVDQPCFIIAEAGVNHNGNPELAHRLVDVAADAGVQAIKFQTFDPEAIASAAAPKADYQRETTGSDTSQLAMLRGLVLPRENYESLIQHARQRGMLFLSTPFDEGSADFLEQLDLPAFKVPSGELNNLPFLAHLARKRRPLLMSTGMSTLVEVVDAVTTVADSGSPPIALFHCVSAYPAPASDCNLRAMETLRARFQVPVGWSDHTVGLAVSTAAVAMGANLLEKHFTLDRNMPGPDHRMSLEPDELKTLVSAVREAEQARGDGIKRPAACESSVAAAARKSLHLARSLPGGAILRSEDLVARRPGTGVSPSQLQQVVGRKLAVAVDAGELLRECDLV
jgi:N-acetylneuraminate synthase/N,N'-diacetyllegionaminate synthase